MKANDNALRFTASGAERADMENFVSVLSALGLDVSATFSASGKTANVRVGNLPTEHEATIRRTRRAGRKASPIMPPNGSVFNCETTLDEFLAWEASNTVAECMGALGISSRATYYRTLKRIRDAKAEQDRANARRAREGRPPLAYRIGNA